MGKKLVYGVGVNDADYVVFKEVSKQLNGIRKRKVVWSCPFYICWKSMIERCHSEKLHKKRPTYINKKVCDEWLIFSNFKSWMINQNYIGMHLDKDLLMPGNKVYCPDFCVFIPPSINSFIVDESANRGRFPFGVTYSKSKKCYVAQCRDPFVGKQQELGAFSCPDEAHNAWKRRKHEIACQLADLQTDERVSKALRLRYASQTKV